MDNTDRIRPISKTNPKQINKFKTNLKHQRQLKTLKPVQQIKNNKKKPGSDLDENLKKVVNYTEVAEEVALYNKESLKWWISTNADWREKIHSKKLRWTSSWDAAGKNASFRALEEWLNSEVNIVPCRATLEWPPSD